MKVCMTFKDFTISNAVQERTLISLSSFKKLYHKITTHDMKLLEAVKAFLPNAANVSEENEKLARTTSGQLNYKNMKNKIMKIFGNPSAMEDNGGSLALKEDCIIGFGRMKYP